MSITFETYDDIYNKHANLQTFFQQFGEVTSMYHIYY